MKEARIVTYKNGKSKGLAYVEFEDEQSASKALLQTDGMLIDDRQISVAISNPPKRGSTNNELTKEEGKQRIANSLGSGSVTSRVDFAQPSNSFQQPQATSSKQTSFVPRSQLVGRKKTLNLL